MPQELRKILDKREFKTSPKTKDKNEARLRAASVIKDAYEQIAIARTKASGETNVELSLRSASSSLKGGMSVCVMRWNLKCTG